MPYPRLFGDKTSYESFILFDLIPWALGFVMIGYNLFGFGVWGPFLLGRTSDFPFMNKVWFALYKFFQGWENVAQLF